MGDLRYRAATAADRAAVAGILTASWGGTTVVAHGVSRDTLTLPALRAERDRRVMGLLTYTIVDCELEVVSLDAVVRRAGVGSGLLRAAAELARDAGARRIRLVTTNDDLDALRFYQWRGMRIVGVGSGAGDEARTLKPFRSSAGTASVSMTNSSWN